MMTLRLMTTFFESVDSKWRSPIADAIASRWIGDDADVVALRASANFVFRAVESEEANILRFNHVSEREAGPIEGELAFIEHLVSLGIRAAQAVKSRKGRLVESVETQMGEFHAVLFEALPGKHRAFADMDPPALDAWGRCLGRVHAGSRGFESGSRPSWLDHIRLAERWIPESEGPALEELRFLEEHLRGLPEDRENFGLIHFDFELDNILWHDGEPGLVDFDDCAFYPFEADIAFALRDLFEDRVTGIDPRHETLQAFLEGYRSVRDLSEGAVERLPLFLRLHNLISFARIRRSMGEGPGSDDPPWALDLRERLSGTLQKLRREFVESPVRRIGGR
jgi:Ser/Thr protein kinase RdoA (MazF antagonist)